MSNWMKRKMEKMDEKHYEEVSSFLSDMGLTEQIPKEKPIREVISYTKKILLVDDNIEIRGLIKDTLKDESFMVLESSNGKEAMQVFGQHPNIDLILIDLQMPEMNGFQFLKLARSLKIIEDVPVMVVTGFINPKTLSAAVKLKVKDFIVKPFSPEIIYQKIMQTLKGPA